MNRHCDILPGGGAILLGDKISCDGAAWGRPVRIVTHVHDDHIRDFERSLHYQDKLLMLPATRDLLYAIKGKKGLELRKEHLIALNAEIPWTFDKQSITLWPANHILGSAQVLVETEEGLRLGYTGDFGWPTKIMQVDELVIDATYGSPEYVRRYKEQDVIDELIKLLRSLIAQGKRICIRAYTGRLQFAMQLVQCLSPTPFIAGKKQKAIADVYREYGALAVAVVDRNTEEGIRIASGREPFISYCHLGENISEEEYDVSIIMSAFMVPREEPVIQTGERSYRVALTDHADFNGTMEYVRQSGARLVLVDNSRGGNAVSLATEIKSQLGIEAIARGW